MDDLAVFLRARLDEDDAAAQRVRSSWRQIGETGVIVASDGERAEECANGNWAGIAEHIVRHDPARVLREIQAHRTTVDEYDIALGAPAATDQAAYWKGHAETLREVCLRLATVHADHPDYREAWRP